MWCLVCIEHIQTVSLLDFKNFITIVCVRNVWPHWYSTHLGVGGQLFRGDSLHLSVLSED